MKWKNPKKFVFWTTMVFPLKNKTGNTIKEQLEQVFMSFGPPETLQSDNGKEFLNSDVKL